MRLLARVLPTLLLIAVAGWICCGCYKGNPPWPVDPTQPRKVAPDAGVPRG